MASGRPHRRLGQLWQMPLLLASLGLFGYAAYLFIDPKPGPTLSEKIDAGRAFLKQERAESAIAQFNQLLSTEKLDRDQEGAVHQLLAEALDLHQRQKRLNVPVYHQRIVEQSKLALGLGAKVNGDFYRRMGESYEALRLPVDALAAYRQAMALDTSKSLRLLRKVVELQLSTEDAAGASVSLEEFLGRHEITDSERAWAMGESAHLMIDRGKFAEARQLLGEAATRTADVADQGQINYWLGYCAWKLGDDAEAERQLRVARDQLKVRHPLDGEAAFVLGRLYQEGRHDPATAASFFEVVLQSHPDSRVAPLARLGRGVCRLAANRDDAGLTDLHDLVNQIDQKDAARAGFKARYRDEVLAGLRLAARLLADHENYQGALEVMAYEQGLDPEPPASFYARLGSIYERRGEQLERAMADEAAAAADPARSPDARGQSAEAAKALRLRQDQQLRDCRARAGDAFVAYSRALTLADDKGYGDALWKGIDLYDRAGDLQRVISALELFVAERPDDAQAPDALLRLGRSYQAAGLFDKAIGSFQRNQFRHGHTLAASKSAIPLAQAYVAKGPEFYAKAEKVLLGVVENNPIVSPDALEFREALFELAQLYYRTSRFEEAVNRLEELTQRYPNEPRMGQVVFLMADSYRKSANLIRPPGSAGPPVLPVADADEPGRPGARPAAARPPGAAPAEARPASAQLTAARPASARRAEALGAVAAVASADDSINPIDPIEALAARKDRLRRARELYDRVIDLYHRAPPGDEVGKLYQKLSFYYRADCVYDLGRYDEAIRLYDAAAFRYQDDPSSLAAYVQIVNAYCALGRMAEAKTANERARVLLKRMPAEAFNDGGFTMPKEYWEKWLWWTSQSGLWK